MLAYFLLTLAALVCLTGAVKCTIVLQSTIVETLEAASAPYGQAGATNITHTGLNKSTVRDANSAAGENATQSVYGTAVMVAGAVTINLAAIPGLGGVNKDLTGLRIRSIHLRAKSDNANPITIAKGAANGYTGCGAAFSATLLAGRELLIEPDQTAVAAGVRTLDVSGTGAQVLEFIITAGSN